MVTNNKKPHFFQYFGASSGLVTKPDKKFILVDKTFFYQKNLFILPLKPRLHHHKHVLLTLQIYGTKKNISIIQTSNLRPIGILDVLAKHARGTGDMA